MCIRRDSEITRTEIVVSSSNASLAVPARCSVRVDVMHPSLNRADWSLWSDHRIFYVFCAGTVHAYKAAYVFFVLSLIYSPSGAVRPYSQSTHAHIQSTTLSLLVCMPWSCSITGKTFLPRYSVGEYMYSRTTAFKAMWARAVKCKKFVPKKKKRTLVPKTFGPRDTQEYVRRPSVRDSASMVTGVRDKGQVHFRKICVSWLYWRIHNRTIILQCRIFALSVLFLNVYYKQ